MKTFIFTKMHSSRSGGLLYLMAVYRIKRNYPEYIGLVEKNFDSTLSDDVHILHYLMTMKKLSEAEKDNKKYTLVKVG